VDRALASLDPNAMAKRKRRRQQPQAQQPRLKAPTSDYADADGNVLTLRGSMTPATRLRYARTLAGGEGSAASTLEDAWQRAAELLFEHLAVRWVIAGAPISRQRELLQRFRSASPDERAWVRQMLREHCAEHFPELQAP
jgi:hypothetical protein